VKLLDSLRESADQLNEIDIHIAVMRQKLDRVIASQRRFEADTAHELRTPIAALRVKLEGAALQQGEVDVEDLLERALQDVSQLQEIVNDLHLLAEMQSAATTAERAPVDLSELVQAEVSLRPDGHEVELQTHPGIMVDAIAPKLGRLLTELLDNARRHARHTVRVKVGRTGEQAELTVADDGEGIDEADRERIFDQFTRLDEARSRDRGGSGLGLTIVHNIANDHQGTVHVENSSLGGACFVVRLPLAPCEQPIP
jgi:signal transduction histidine kinase